MDIAVEIKKVNDWDQISYVGPIDEDAEFHLMPLIKQTGPKCVFNFKGVVSVNSCGVRVWIQFMREFEKGRQIVFEECTPEIVGQINMIPNFKGDAHIRSVYASYVCENCDMYKWELFEENKNMPTHANDFKLPEVRCASCNGVMEMEELPEEFFDWLQG